MGMYYYMTINLHVRPDAPATVHQVIQSLCKVAVLDDGGQAILDALRRDSSDPAVLDHPYFACARWYDIFGNWAGLDTSWAWDDKKAIVQYNDNHLFVRCSHKSHYEYENFVDWIKPWLADNADDCVFGWYEEYMYGGSPPTTHPYGNDSAMRKLAPYISPDSPGYFH